MRLSCRNVVIEIDDLYVSYSPYLSLMKKTEIGVDRIDSIYMLDIDPIYMQEYISFLKGKSFQMNSDVAYLFDYMGHHNDMQYPLDYWRVKLRDNWIRDNFYRLKLYKQDPYCGLTEIPIKNRLDIPLSDNLYIAGGAALYMSGYIDSFKDIDVFCTDKDSLLKYLSTIEYERSDYDIHRHPHLISISGRIWVRQKLGLELNDDPRYGYYPSKGDIKSSDHPVIKTLKKLHVWKTQFMFRLYTCPSEIVHGFDLDCVGVLYDGKKLWCTERTLYSLNNKVNWFDPSRSSPSYAYRLSKYSLRGFSIGLPHFDPERVKDEVVKSMCSSISDMYDKTDINLLSDDEFEDDHIVFSDDDSFSNEDINALILSIQNKMVSSLSSDMKKYIKTEGLSTANDLRHHAKIISKDIMTEYILSCTNDIVSQIENNMKKDRDSRKRPSLPEGNEYGSMVRRILGTQDKYKYNRPLDEPVCLNRMKLKKIIPSDPVSILILSSVYGFHTSLWIQSDYIPKKYRNDNMKMNEALKNIEWKTQNPMEQVTSTLYPSPISDIKEWYKSSPLYSK